MAGHVVKVHPILKSLLIGTLGTVNYFPSRETGKYELQQLMRSLFPINAGSELIRLGPEADGGYLVPEDLSGIEACFSPGVGFVSGFEKDCAAMGIKVFLADGTVERPPEPDSLFYFTRKNIGALTGDMFMTLDRWVNSSLPGTQGDLMLQMDVEGYEYEIILNASDSLISRFRIIVAEFHDLDQLWNRPFFKLASRAFEKILLTHSCVHIHPNNARGQINKRGLAIPELAEFTFLRNDRISNPLTYHVFPHPLDRDNTNNPPLPLPACWYGR